MKPKSGTAKPKRFSTSLVVGLLLVPLSAVAAVALVNPDASAEPEETVAAEVVVESTTTTQAAEEIAVPEIASSDDLAAACGDQGMSLVMKEADASISPLEQAALDSLRAICLAEGLELPGPPAPEAVVQTVTVVAAPGSSSDSDDASNNAAAEFEADYAATVNYINAAIAEGANGDKIAGAERLVGEAANLADAGDYEGGMNKLEAARRATDEAVRSDHHDDDDYDDDEYDDDDDHDDDDHDEDEDDEHEDDEGDDDEDDD